MATRATHRRTVLALALVAAAPGCSSKESSERRPAASGSAAAAPAAEIPAAERAAIPGRIIFALEEREQLGVWEVEPRGGEPREVAVEADHKLYPATGAPLLVIATSGHHAHDHGEQLLLIEGGKRVPIGPDTARVRNPAWAPDGAWFVFESDHQSFRDLYRYHLADGSLLRLTNAEHGSFEPAVSPDGSRIAFVSSRDGNAELYVMNADGTEQRRLTHIPSDDWSPRWSPDGTTLAFMSDREGVGRIYLMSAEGGEARRLDQLEGDDLHQEELAWSPDGARIATTVRGINLSEVWVTDVTTGARTRITGAGARDANPAWSPDGRYLVFSRSRGKQTDLYLTRADGTGTTRLTKAGGAAWLPRWSS